MTLLLALGLGVDIALCLLPLAIWMRHGRDPHFADDDSVLMPSPPRDFSPALASVVLEGRASRRTIEAGLMDLVGRDLLKFTAEPSAIGHRAGIGTTPHTARHMRLPAPEAALYQAIAGRIGPSGRMDAIFLGSLAGTFSEFSASLDEIAVQRGWLERRPGRVIRRWRILAAAEGVAGIFLIGWIASALDQWTRSSAIDMATVGAGMLFAALVTLVVSGAMPARTAEGAWLAGMLKGYRRTLKMTIAQAESLEQVVVMAPLPWVGTPGEEVAWGVSFGLAHQIDDLLTQSLELSGAGGWPMDFRDWFKLL